MNGPSLNTQQAMNILSRQIYPKASALNFAKQHDSQPLKERVFMTNRIIERPKRDTDNASIFNNNLQVIPQKRANPTWLEAV